MSDFIRLGDNLRIAKGRPPKLMPYDGVDAILYLTPEYLRNRGSATLVKSGSDAVISADGDAILLWDGSNAGEFFHGKAGLVASTMARLVPSGKFHRRYFAHVLKQLEPRLKNKTNGTGIPHVDRDVLESSNVFCPELSEQVQIAKIFDTLDTAIHQTEAIIEKLKLIKQGLLHDLLTRGIDANGDLRPPQSQAPHLYKDSPLGWIAADWCAVPLGKLASLQRGHDIVESNFILGPYPVISSSGIIGYHNVATARGPNVIVGRKGSIGTVHFVETDFWAHDTSLFVTNFFGNDPRFVFHLLDFMQLGQYGTKSGSPSLNRNDVHPKFVGRPKLNEQRGIVSIISAYSERMKQVTHERAKLRQLKSGLMDDLLSGRVRVTPLLNTVGPKS